MREVGDEFWVVTLVNEGSQLMGVWVCEDQDAVNELVRTVTLEQIRGHGVVAPQSPEGQRLIKLMEDAHTEAEITSARINFEQESDWEFDVYTQRMWSNKTALDAMKEAVDEGT